MKVAPLSCVFGGTIIEGFSILLRELGILGAITLANARSKRLLSRLRRAQNPLGAKFDKVKSEEQNNVLRMRE